MKDKKALRAVVFALLGLAAAFVLYYVFLPPINIHAKEFWFFLTAVIFLFTLPYLNAPEANGSAQKKSYPKGVIVVGNRGPFNKIPLLLILLPLAISLVFSIVSSHVFNAKRYAGVIEVKEAVFKDDMPETKNVRNIALMDTPSAQIIGSRALGALSGVVSQYDLNSEYTQINYQNHPEKLSNLEYAGFFKWLNNRGKGVPGYVMVDPVNNTAEYKELSEPLFYVDSGFFSDDLSRALRFRYPTKIFGNISFEIDEAGKPFFIVSCMSPKVSVYGAMDVNEVIVFDPSNGDSTLYGVDQTPTWIDIVYDGYLASDKYDWYGELSGGFWNSVIGNVGCKRCTDDFGYIAMNDDVWYFTGVTSVNEDSSNIGFILSNARTGEYKFYPVIGAEEYSAMHAAEGEVQEKAYVASFPSLISVSGEATYIMVLKDNGGLVKLYALVNVTTYSIVATGQTQEEAMAAYTELLYQNGILEKAAVTEDTLAFNTKITNVRLAYVGGETVVYLNGEDGKVYKRPLSEDEGLMLLGIGDPLAGDCVPTDTDGVYLIVGRK